MPTCGVPLTTQHERCVEDLVRVSIHELPPVCRADEQQVAGWARLWLLGSSRGHKVRGGIERWSPTPPQPGDPAGCWDASVDRESQHWLGKGWQLPAQQQQVQLGASKNKYLGPARWLNWLIG